MSRGCVYRCVHCSQSKSHHGIRYRSIESVIREIETLKHRYNDQIGAFFFLDLILTYDKQRILDLCRKIVDRGLNRDLNFFGQTRPDRIDLEIACALKKAGFVMIQIGAESIDETVLALDCKMQQLKDIERCSEIVKQTELHVTFLFILGLPGETRESIRKTCRFARSLYCDAVALNIATPYPGTILYEWAKQGKHGLKLIEQDFSKFHQLDESVMQVGSLSPDTITFLQRIYLVYVNFTWTRIRYHLRMMGFSYVVKQLLKYYWKFLDLLQKKFIGKTAGEKRDQ